MQRFFTFSSVRRQMFFFCEILILPLLLILSTNAMISPKEQKKVELLRCFQSCYHVDEWNSEILLEKFNPLFPDYIDVIDAFIKESKKLQIDFTAPIIPKSLSLDDAVIASPDQHEVVFESDHVRILWSQTSPGEIEPFHRHPWKRIIVMIREASYRVIDGDTGEEQIENYKIGVYDGEPDEFYFCQNIGEIDACLGFEIKE